MCAHMYTHMHMPSDSNTHLCRCAADTHQHRQMLLCDSRCECGWVWVYAWVGGWVGVHKQLCRKGGEESGRVMCHRRRHRGHHTYVRGACA